MSFLSGEGEMARLLRDFPWKDHPFGTPDQWPQSLRSALGICLNSAFPTAIYWGAELRLLYNDAWSHIPGPRHPACLGAPAKDVWADIWHVIEPQFAQVIETGEGLFVEDQMLPMRRFGFEEETYWSYSFTPIRGEDGGIEGIFNSGFETTDKVLRERQMAFLLETADRIRVLSGTDEVVEATCRMLGEYLGALRVGVREYSPLENAYPVKAEWLAEDRPKAANVAQWTDFGAMADRLAAGHVVRIDRTADLQDTRLSRIFTELGAGAVVNTPWFGSSGLDTVLFVHMSAAHAWTDAEVATIEQVFAQAMHKIEQERAQERETTMLREIDHRARNLLGISQALVRMTKAEDVDSLKRSLADRMGALSKTLNILSESEWTGATFRELLDLELLPFGAADSEQVTLSGPDVILPPNMVQPIAMAIHELTTNAVKYGGLSDSDGSLEVSWCVDETGMLRIAWREQRPESSEEVNVDTPGFGSRLLTLTVESQLGGRFERQFQDHSFECLMDIPLPQARELSVAS